MLRIEVRLTLWRGGVTAAFALIPLDLAVRHLERPAVYGAAFVIVAAARLASWVVVPDDAP